MLASGPLSLKARALRMLALREHSRAELARKLSERVPDGQAPPEAGELERVLDELETRGLISEARLVDSVLHQRAGRLGRSRVLHELRQKGVSEQALLDASEQLRDSELARAQAVWAKKFGELASAPAERARQLRFLAARGFSADVAQRVVRGEGDDPA